MWIRRWLQSDSHVEESPDSHWPGTRRALDQGPRSLALPGVHGLGDGLGGRGLVGQEFHRDALGLDGVGAAVGEDVVQAVEFVQRRVDAGLG